MQAHNDLCNLDRIKFICIEPVSIFFNNLKSNIREANSKASFTLLNIGLGNLSNAGASVFISKRNSTSTQSLDLALDVRKDLIEEKVQIISVFNFIKTYLEPLSYDYITVKSDTDGSDIAIFDALINSTIGFKITCYVLEIILTGVTETERSVLLKNCNNFSQWLFIDRNNNSTLSKNIITGILKSNQGYVGDLYLTNV